jgi:hypothetical protein
MKNITLAFAALAACLEGLGRRKYGTLLGSDVDGLVNK